MMKPILVSLFGDRGKGKGQRYFVAITCFIVSAFLLFRAVLHLLMGLSTTHILLALMGSLFTLALYLLARFTKHLKLPMVLLSLLGLILLDWVWYAKFMSMGPLLFFIMIFGVLLVWMWDGRIMFLMLGIYLINFIALYFIEINSPGVMLAYPEGKSRSLDIYTSIALYGALLSWFLFMVKKDSRRKEKRALESDKLKSAFLANMSHEIRTPMNSIIGFSNLLTKELNEEEFDHYKEVIQTNSDNLLRLINDIIDLSKVEAGDMKMEISDFSVRELLRECQAQFSIELEKRGKSYLQISLNLSEDDYIIQNDYMRLKQVLSNLLSNAIKFTTEGGITLSCKRKGKDLIFSVSDTGTGIPDADQGKIFDRFTTFSYKGMNEEGSGIGLSIVKKIVEMLGGKVWFTSLEGIGTTFFISIPFHPSTVQVEQLTKTKTAMISKSGKRSGKSILLVEDEFHSQELIRKMLKPLEMEIHNVADGNDAIRHIIMNPDTSLVLMDLKLPNLDGYEATRLIKKVHPEIPVIAQTAYAMAGDREKAMNAGCDEYLTKPLTTSTLIPVIKSYLKG